MGTADAAHIADRRAQNDGFWSYEACPFRRVRQFRGQSADDEDATVVALGSYDPGGDEVLTAASGDVLYIQHFRGGSGGRSAQIRCGALRRDRSAAAALTHAPRGTRFLCHQGKGPQLVSAKEPDQHRYTLTVHAPALCNVGSESPALAHRRMRFVVTPLPHAVLQAAQTRTCAAWRSVIA